MLGDLIGEGKGRRIVRRILSTEPPTAEVTFESAGTILGVGAKETGTYTSELRPDGSIFGDGQGLMITSDGDTITWAGSGLGKIWPRRFGQLSRNDLLPNHFPEARASE